MSLLRARPLFSIARQFSTNTQRNKSKLGNKIKVDQVNSPWEHLYGISSVLAALHSRKRVVLDILYIQHSEEKKTTQKKDDQLITEIKDLAKQLKIKVTVANKGELNNLTNNKPHQGVVLKSSKRYPIEISELTRVNNTDYDVIPKLNKRGSEEDRERNTGLSPIKLSRPESGRMPFWIALDEVQDPQNLGSILRTAHFFGIDGVLVCSKNSASLSPTVSKVSSGAIEVMDIYSTSNLTKFLKSSHANGWEVVGAAGDANPSVAVIQLSDICQKPTILVLGNEGTGLRTNVKNACSLFVSIPKAINTNDHFNGSVDSLNVGVAAGILISSALSRHE